MNQHQATGQAPVQKQGGGGVMVALAAVGAVTLLLVGGAAVVFLTRDSPSQSGRVADSRGAPGPLDLLGKLRPQATLVDEEVAIRARGWQLRNFRLSEPRRVRVIAEGLTHADKGFMVHVADADNCGIIAQGSANTFTEFEGVKTRAFSHTATLPAGSYCAAVNNSENLLNTAVVHLQVVTDPS